LEKYFGTDVTIRPRPGDSTRYNVTGGYAWIVPEPMYTPTDTTDDFTFIVRSTGYVIHPAQGSTPLGSRTIAQFAVWQTGAIPEYAALTTASGVKRLNNGYVEIQGQDLICGTGESVHHTRTYAGDDPDYSVDVWSGTYFESGTMAGLATSLNMDWAVINSGDFESDYTSFRAWDTTYPTIVIIGDYTLTNSGGYGLLVVTGQLTTTGNFSSWKGLVLVGGRARFQALENTYYGAVVTGMDKQLGENESETEVGGRTDGVDRYTYIYYAPCYIDEALKSLTGFRPLKNTLVDNWAAWGN